MLHNSFLFSIYATLLMQQDLRNGKMAVPEKYCSDRTNGGFCNSDTGSIEALQGGAFYSGLLPELHKEHDEHNDCCDISRGR
jgi:hypothetical protein